MKPSICEYPIPISIWIPSTLCCLFPFPSPIFFLAYFSELSLLLVFSLICLSFTMMTVRPFSFDVSFEQCFLFFSFLLLLFFNSPLCHLTNSNQQRLMPEVELKKSVYPLGPFTSRFYRLTPDNDSQARSLFLHFPFLLDFNLSSYIYSSQLELI